MDIQISYQYKRNKKILKAVSDSLKRFAAKLNTNEKILVAFVDDMTIQKLNKRFKHLDKPTNVLSFDINQLDPEDGKITLGEIIISVDTANKEALKVRMSLNDRLVELFIHGYVHLLGYDHVSYNEYTKMKRKENTLMKLMYINDEKNITKRV